MMLIPVVISGGAGTRLWPISRESDPKPFMKLPDGETIIGKTFKRATELNGVTNIIAVTNNNYYFRTKEEFENSVSTGAELDCILEPFGRNTAPAITAAAIKIHEEFGDDAIMLVLPADHLIPEQDIFEQAVSKAISLASAGYLATFGIIPTRPDTGFGYIQKGESIGISGFNVSRFVEKPDLTTAQKYLASGNFFWNSGMFCFQAKTYLEALSETSPAIHSQVKKCLDASITDTQSSTLDSNTFAQVENISIDYAVMEKADNVAVVSANFQWNDIGSWSALSEVYNIDNNCNAIDGDAILIDSQKCLVKSDHRLTAVIGLDDVVVINDNDATLVVNKNNVQDVKKVVSALKQENRPEHVEKITTRRPWGSYTNLIESDQYKVKKIIVFPQQSLSLQKHKHRSEHWTVVKGSAEIINGNETLSLGPNQSTYIEKEAVHRLTNIGETELELIEVQCGTYLGEDDIIRLEDVYGRT